MKGMAGKLRKAENIGNSRKTRKGEKTRKGGKGGKGTKGKEVGHEGMGNAGEMKMMCPWTEREENMAVDKFIEILSNYVREQVEASLDFSYLT
ncbi:hypothetical protein L198_05504 [Cryptococcus wingfieldii CBS 7118]|uniref:Uncharacterized protein n=1 Tax=Cryptococcus wingfieldii CBS 7118 TaxID=1295528 RepID=A0A1E3IVR4_9TREE|nr:hypothetical protein L198_05504 [Cryptococcus wingfieldii CBS 7118]ODN92710.1 hypothetical protein L198_05504 [Cryptococcus wingfieldii CBS 7118]